MSEQHSFFDVDVHGTPTSWQKQRLSKKSHNPEQQ